MKRVLMGVAVFIGTASCCWGDHHEAGQGHKGGVGVLAQDVGTWTAEMKMWMSPEGGTPVTSTAVEVNKMLPGGTWLISKMEGNFEGVEFHGRGQFGYDPGSEKYAGTWIDNMSPHMMHMEGSYDEGTKTMTQHAKQMDARTGKVQESKFETKYGDNTRTMTMYMKNGDEYWKHMEVTYKRKVKST